MSEELIVVRGNGRLQGTVKVSGAKNSALKLIAASILGQGPVTISNVPDISDIAIMADVLAGMGAKVEREGDVLVIDTAEMDSIEAPYELVSMMRASIAVLGPLVARFGRARVAMPGGCRIGARKIDMHLAGLEALGVSFEVDHGFLEAKVEGELRGASVALDFPSVGATENLMMAAVCAKGTTVIENAAREPEIADLAAMLNEMGAHVEGAGSSVIEIHGVDPDELHPCSHRTVGDRIEAGTFLVGGALTGGPVCVEGIDPSFLRMALLKLQLAGCEVEADEEAQAVTVSRTKPLKPLELQTLPHPGFPTDLQAQFMLLAAVAEGNSVITENVFENRFMFAGELARMGADVTIEGHHAIVTGVDGLQGAPVTSTDLRGGAALVLAGVIASGTTEVRAIEHIDRGYEDYVGKLTALGADVARVREQDLKRDGGNPAGTAASSASAAVDATAGATVSATDDGVRP